jgi:Predicted integral membrane protein (DUF2269)
VDLSGWLLSLHLLAAAALVSAEVLFTVMILASRNAELPSAVTRLNGVSRVGNVLVGVGSVGVLVLGVILAFQKDAYAIWDPWIVAAIVLWAIFAETGRRTGAHYDAASDRAEALAAEGDTPSPELNAMMRDSRALMFHILSVAAVVLMLLDMIFKPGA